MVGANAVMVARIMLRADDEGSRVYPSRGDARNTQSQRVPKKLGMTPERVLRSHGKGRAGRETMFTTAFCAWSGRGTVSVDGFKGLPNVGGPGSEVIFD